MRWLAALLLVGVAGAADAELKIEHVSVKSERRADKDWCVLDVQVSGEVPATVESLAAVIQNYQEYPRWFPHLEQVSWESSGTDVLLSETVVVAALGARSVNRFTVRMTPTPTPDGFSLPWTLEATDGTIDGVTGSWSLENRGASDHPSTWVTYRTQSTVLSVAFGQDLLLRLFLGGETKDIVEAIVREARQSSSGTNTKK